MRHIKQIYGGSWISVEIRCKSGEPDIRQLMDAITNVPTRIQKNTWKQKLLQTQVPNIRGQKRRYNEFRHLLLNHRRPFQNEITEKEQLHIFTSFLREDAVEFWQTIRPQTPHSERSSRCSEKNTLEMTLNKHGDTNGISSKMTPLT